jgi:hypothetical protein
MEKEDRIIVLKNQVEAQLLSSILKEKKIPYLIRSYADIAYNGIFQVQQGWGHVETPDEYLDQVKEIYQDLCQDK